MALYQFFTLQVDGRVVSMKGSVLILTTRIFSFFNGLVRLPARITL